MNTESSLTRAAGLLFIRALLGIILFMQGFGKVFSMGVPQVYDKFFQPYESTFLPHWLIMVTAYYTSYVELIGGVLLLTGLFRKYALYLIAIDLCVVAFGHGMMQPSGICNTSCQGPSW